MSRFADGTIGKVLLRKYQPVHVDNRMRGEGDVIAARADFAARKSMNLFNLLQSRYRWMNRYIDSESLGADIGCGAGLSEKFIHCKRLFLTDYAWQDFLDVAGVDALRLPFREGSLNFLILTNVIHHLPYPLRFFQEARRVLASGGVILIHEVHASLLFRCILRLMRHEGYSFDINPFAEDFVCTRPDDPWAGNNALPRVLFQDWKRFFEESPGWELLLDEKCECLSFLNSGGVTAKTVYVPLPRVLLSAVDWIDTAAVRLAPDLLALGRRIALRKKEVVL
ncbi:MAG: class I SAM-dependent methyltransferase [Bryobacteraceae bacterium]